jgi:hypothetical protein
MSRARTGASPERGRSSRADTRKRECAFTRGVAYHRPQVTLTGSSWSCACVLLTLATLSARRADACSGCQQGAVAAGNALPVNAPAIALYTPAFFGNLQDGGVSLRASDGGSIPVQIETDPRALVANSSWLLRPSTPLTPDTDYVVSFDDACRRLRVDVPFHTVAAQPLPIAQPQVTLGPLRVGSATTTTLCGSCVTQIQAAAIDVFVTAPADFAPFADVVRYSLRVDGAAWRQLPVGSRAPTGGAIFTLYGRCQRPTPNSSEDDGLTLGPHVAEVRAHVAGSSLELVSNPVSFELTCGGACLDGPNNWNCKPSGPRDCAGNVLGPPDSGAGGSGGGVADGGTNQPTVSAGSCSSAPGLWALASLLWLARRRERGWRRGWWWSATPQPADPSGP